MNTKRLIPVLVLLTLLAGAGIAWTEMTHRPRTVDVTIKGMSCEGCAKAISDKLAALPGAADVKVSHETGHATLTLDGWSATTDKDIKDAVAAAEYEVVEIK
jgi:copper chaperone CopZ